jgi:hypothetical protein
MLLSGDPKERPFLIHMSNLITKRLSLLQCVNIIADDQVTTNQTFRTFISGDPKNQSCDF